MSASQLDSGLAAGNYFDYTDDDVATQREYEIMESLPDYYVDPCFPPDARSLYFDPFHPPKGASPGSSFVWSRLCKKEVLLCEEPVFCLKNPQSAMITQGALGNSYLVNALRLLASSKNDKQVTRLLVSDKYSSQGMWTFKFFKTGRWRYVHVDDLIPCRQSGRVNFCRNVNPNEIFAMLLEKAYAKLHGCYEAIVNGLIEKALIDLTPAGHTAVIRNERQTLEDVCDKAWECIETGLSRGHTVGCGKFLPDPYCEKLADRQGITAGIMYHVVDACQVTAQATAELDTLTMGMVCVRNLQSDEGRFVGRWSYGHPSWQQYKDIGVRLRHRTREVMFKRGLGLDPNAINEETGELINFVTSDRKDLKLYNEEQRLLQMESERDGLAIEYLGRTRFPPPQPEEKDLYWMQIEDFVDIFNRIYDFSDLSLSGTSSEPAGFRRYYSKWIPGDFLAGSGGPPVLLRLKKPLREVNPADPEINETLRLLNDADEQARRSEEAAGSRRGSAVAGGAGGGGTLAAPSSSSPSSPRADSKPAVVDSKDGPTHETKGDVKDTSEVGAKQDDAAAAAAAAAGGGGGEVNAKDSKDEPSAAPALAQAESSAAATAEAKDAAVMGEAGSVAGSAGDASGDGRRPSQDISISHSVQKDAQEGTVYGPITVAAIPVSALYDDEDVAEVADEDEEEEEPWEPMRINEDFTDNPMYPFSVSEPAQICFVLYQPDRRWSVGRMGEDPRDITAARFASRGERLASCMRYSRALGFVIVRLFGSKMRLTDFKLRKIVGCSDYVEYSNAASCCVHLRPGRYAVIPFTEKALAETEHYVLHAQFLAKQVEFEVQDLLVEKPMDNDISDDESNEDEEEEDSDDDREEYKRPDVAAARLAARNKRILDAQKRKYDALLCKPPSLVETADWEFVEDSENMAQISVFDEVGDLSRHLFSLRADLWELKKTAKEISTTLETRRVLIEEATAASKAAEEVARIAADAAKTGRKKNVRPPTTSESPPKRK